MDLVLLYLMATELLIIQIKYKKYILIFQNLYLASERIGCGCCAIGAYAQDKMDVILKVDGEEEFSKYYILLGILYNIFTYKCPIYQ